MKRLSAEELRAAKKANNINLLWEQADPLCKYLISYVIRKGMDPAYATDDMLQEARLAAGLSIRTWDPDKGAFSTWVGRRVQGAIADHIRRQSSGMVGGRSAEGTTGSYVDVTPCERPNGEAIALQQGEAARAHLLLNQLDDFEEVQAIRLRFGFDEDPMTVPEIAKRLGKGLSTTELLLSNTLKSLRGFVAA